MFTLSLVQRFLYFGSTSLTFLFPIPAPPDYALIRPCTTTFDIGLLRLECVLGESFLVLRRFVPVLRFVFPKILPGELNDLQGRRVIRLGVVENALSLDKGVEEYDSVGWAAIWFSGGFLL